LKEPSHPKRGQVKKETPRKKKLFTTKEREKHAPQQTVHARVMINRKGRQEPYPGNFPGKKGPTLTAHRQIKVQEKEERFSLGKKEGEGKLTPRKKRKGERNLTASTRICMRKRQQTPALSEWSPRKRRVPVRRKRERTQGTLSPKGS